MCPVCMATAAIIAGSTAGSGGLTALTVGLFRRKDRVNKFPKSIETKEVDHDDDRDRDGECERSIAE
jgi:hypothetical protein